MTPTPLRLLLCAALGAFPAASLGQQLPEEVEPLPFGETITVDGTVSSVGAKSECWLFRPAGRTFIGADEFPIFSVIDLPEEFRQPVLRVTITGVFLLHSDRGCFSTREIVIQSIEMADGPQLRRDVYVRLSEAQSCLEGNDNNCAVAILDEIESTYELNAYEKWQLWNFKAFMYIGGDETSLGFHALEEILMLGDITEWFAPEPWTTYILRSIRDEQYSDALRIIDLVCAYRSCDELGGLRSEVVSALQEAPL